MPKVYGVNVPTRVTTAIVTPLIRLGVGPRHLHLLSVAGRRTGRKYETPVSIVEREDERWLVAPYGEREWVKNARVSGTVRLRRGRRRERVKVEEVPPSDCAPILRAYLSQVPFTRDFFDAAPGDPVDAFAAEAHRHPVFRVDPVSETVGGT